MPKKNSIAKSRLYIHSSCKQKMTLYPIAVSRSRGTHKYGYINSSGEVVINPEFDVAYWFHSERAIVRIGSKYGAIDEAGRLVIPARFPSIEAFSDGLASFRDPALGKFGFMDVDGNYVIDPEFDFEPGRFNEGLARIKTSTGMGLIDRFRTEIIPTKYLWMGMYSEGLVAAIETGKVNRSEVEGMCGYLDKQNQFRISPRFPGPRGPFTGGLAIAGDSSGRFHINTEGVAVYESRWASIGLFSAGLAPASLHNDLSKGHLQARAGYIDRNGLFQIEPLYIDTNEFRCGFGQVVEAATGSKSSLHNFIAPDGTELTSRRFTSASGFYEDLAHVEWTEKRFKRQGYINTKGDFVWEEKGLLW